MTTTVQRVEQAGQPSAEPTWGWRSGPCRALEHTFEVVVEEGWDSAAVVPVVAPFRIRRRAGGPNRPVVRYEIRSGGREGFVSTFAD